MKMLVIEVGSGPRMGFLWEIQCGHGEVQVEKSRRVESLEETMVDLSHSNQALV